MVFPLFISFPAERKAPKRRSKNTSLFCKHIELRERQLYAVAYKKVEESLMIRHLVTSCGPQVLEHLMVVKFQPTDKKFIIDTLKRGIEHNGSQYLYLGQSNSQLRNKTCVMMNVSLGDIHGLLAKFEDFDEIRPVSRRSHTIAHLFSPYSRSLTLKAEEYDVIDDVIGTRGTYVFTDGCGLMTPEIAYDVQELYKLRHIPSVVQVRFRSFSGVLVSAHFDKLRDLPSPQAKALFRKSMANFMMSPEAVESFDTLGVVDFSQPYSLGYLDTLTVMLLAEGGVSHEYLLTLQTNYYDLLENLEEKTYASYFLRTTGHEDILRVLENNGTILTIRKNLQRLRTEEIEKMEEVDDDDDDDNDDDDDDDDHEDDDEEKEEDDKDDEDDKTHEDADVDAETVENEADKPTEGMAQENEGPDIDQENKDKGLDELDAEKEEEEEEEEERIDEGKKEGKKRDKGGKGKTGTEMTENAAASVSNEVPVPSDGENRRESRTNFKFKLRILVPEAREVFGASDPYGQLKSGECFFQPTLPATEANAFAYAEHVVVIRRPSYHVGDVRVLKLAHDKEMYKDLFDCIVFPVRGARPHANECAGGRVRGEKYFVCWDQLLIPCFPSSPCVGNATIPWPNKFEKKLLSVLEERKKTLLGRYELIEYFGNYTDCGELYRRATEMFSDYASWFGSFCTECEELKEMFSREFDWNERHDEAEKKLRELKERYKQEMIQLAGEKRLPFSRSPSIYHRIQVSLKWRKPAFRPGDDVWNKMKWRGIQFVASQADSQFDEKTKSQGEEE